MKLQLLIIPVILPCQLFLGNKERNKMDINKRLVQYAEDKEHTLCVLTENTTITALVAIARRLNLNPEETTLYNLMLRIVEDQMNNEDKEIL